MSLRRVLRSDYVLLALLTLPATFALLLNPGLPNTADGVLHLYRTVELDRAWRDGIFFPRLAPDFAYGYGYPLFNYYAPLFYFASQILHLVSPSFEIGMKAAIVLIFYLYPLGMYLFTRAFLSRAAARVAAVAYLYTPYRFYEAFIQGDYPQFLALAIVPFCLFALTPAPLSHSGRGECSVPLRVARSARECARHRVRGERFRFFTFVFAYAALVLSHNITALIATPLIGAYILFRLARLSPYVGHDALRVAGSVALALGLTAFFWLPALGEQKYVRIERLTQGFFHYENYFLTPTELLSPNIPPDLAGVNPYIPFNLGPVIFALALLGVLALGWNLLRRRAAQTRSHLFFLIAALALTAMTLPISTPLWEHLPLLKLTEFPWRFVGLAAIPLAALVGLAMQQMQVALPHLSLAHPVPHRTSRHVRSTSLVTAIAIMLLVLDSFVHLFPRTPFLQHGNPSLADIAKFELASGALGTTSAGEYLPIWTQRRMYSSPLVSQLLADRVPDHLQREALPVTVRIAVVAQTIYREAYHFNSAGPLTMRIQRIYFPGWTAAIDGQPVPLELVAPNATMQVLMPAGEHIVDFTFNETVLRGVADGLSLITLGVCVGVWIYGRRKIRQPVAEASQVETTLTPPYSHTPILITSLALIAFYFAAPQIGYVRYSPLPTVLGVQHARDDNVGDQMRLLGYDLSASSVSAGDALALTLYWQPLRLIEKDYAVFVHLDNPLTLETVAQTINDHPGNISTVELPLSLYVRDPHVLRVPATVEPGVYWLRIGLLDTRSDQALPITQSDGSRRTRLLLQTVRVRRAALPDLSDVTLTPVRFGNIELVGYTLDAHHQLTLYWRATQTPNADATVFVHLLDAKGQTVATFDGPPTGGLLPISAWDQDEIVMDRRTLTAPSQGVFRIALGLYDPRTTQRYPARIADGQPLPNDQFVLFWIAP